MLKFFLERILPRDRLIQFDLPEMIFATMPWRPLGTSCVPCRKGGSVQAKPPHWAPSTQLLEREPPLIDEAIESHFEIPEVANSRASVK